MQIIEAGYKIYPVVTKEDYLKRIEEIARTCYKSEDKITEDSAVRMVKSLVEREHYAMLEHVSIAFNVENIVYSAIRHAQNILEEVTKRVFYLRYTFEERGIVSGNLRAWLEFLQEIEKENISIPGDIMRELREIPAIFDNVHPREAVGRAVIIYEDEMTDSEKYVHATRSVKFIVDRGVSHEIVRHRPASFAQESTRFCNYGKNGELTFIDPCFLKVDGVDLNNDQWAVRYGAWRALCEASEEAYLKMIHDGARPEEARSVLPTAVKTEVVMTCSLGEWDHFFDLRVLEKTGKAHVQMKEVSIPVYHEFQKMYPEIY